MDSTNHRSKPIFFKIIVIVIETEDGEGIVLCLHQPGDSGELPTSLSEFLILVVPALWG